MHYVTLLHCSFLVVKDGHGLLAPRVIVHHKVTDVINCIENLDSRCISQKASEGKGSDNFNEPVMEEQVRDNKAWYLLLFTVIDELVSHNLKETIRKFSLSFS